MNIDFSLLLVLGSMGTGIIWGGYLLWLKLRGQAFHAAQEPIIVEYARSFFPVIFIVLLLRSFLVEPFRIPSGSMMPTLLIGDFILVNKFTYGIRLPVLHNKLVALNEPQRGDIVVFRFPKDPSVDYIKRVIGVPGDRIGYHDKNLYVNGELVNATALGVYQGKGKGETMSGALTLSEDLTGVNHDILIRQEQPSVQGDYTVPEGRYFVMGDNRDNSNDSRYWGTVPEENLVGRAFFIWMSWDWDNGGVAWNRLGTLVK
jgi:signal peptidase I